jgi:beta-RFAP synthase
MSTRSLQIDAPSRLHFGLLSFGRASGREFGGVGLMVESPGLSLEAEPAERLTVSGPLSGRVQEFALRWQRYCGADASVGFHLRLRRVAPQHVGLGTGTQLALAVAAALYHLNDRPLPDATTLASAVGRGSRSSVGTHGFLLGGLIIDQGKSPGQRLGSLAARLPLPAAWRVVQLCPLQPAGLSGEAEARAFQQLPPVPAQVTERLLRRIDDELLPAARDGDLDRFGEAVYQYGREAGMCFAPLQGGPFANCDLAAWIETLRRRGVRGAGQSSWGPTLFALTASAQGAEELVAWGQRDRPAGNCPVEWRVSRIALEGARCTMAADPAGRAASGPLNRSAGGLSCGLSRRNGSRARDEVEK